jgi:[NiFe] hydrogenase diaphorase moiety large subunit
MGTPVSDLLQLCGATPQAVQVGGPSGHLLGPDSFDRPLAFSALCSGGSFMVLGAERDLLEVCRNFTGFFAAESCGFCTPCRVGTQLLNQALGRLRQPWHTADHLRQIKQTAHLMRVASHCGLGSSAANPVMDLLSLQPDYFATEPTAPHQLKANPESWIPMIETPEETDSL